MSFVHEKRSAARLLDAFENATLPIDEMVRLTAEADPAWVYLMFGWLRGRYRSGHPASDGVLGRILAVCTNSPKVARMVRSGETDPISEWFEETYEYRDFDREGFIDVVVEKLES